jgi:hypothetical protein
VSGSEIFEGLIVGPAHSKVLIERYAVGYQDRCSELVDLFLDLPELTMQRLRHLPEPISLFLLLGFLSVPARAALLHGESTPRCRLLRRDLGYRVRPS